MAVWRDYGSDTKAISRRVMMSGKYMNYPHETARRAAKAVLCLPGYDVVSGTSSQDIHQGIAEGLIAPDARIIGIERTPELVPRIQKDASQKNLNMTVHHADFRHFVPSHGLDMVLGDLMCGPYWWIGKSMVSNIVPRMNKKSSISINICVQKAFGPQSAEMDRARELFLASPDEYVGVDGWDLKRPQDYRWSRLDVATLNQAILPMKLARSIDVFNGGIHRRGPDRKLENEACFLTFVGLHYYMKDTDFTYRGCYLYRQSSSSMHMMTLYYDRGLGN